MASRKLTWQHEQIDTNTGEIIKQEKRFLIKTDSGDFYQTFLESIAFITKISSGAPLHVLSQLCINAEYNTGTCHLSPERRKEFIKALDISMNYYNQCLMKLEKAGLIKNERGSVKINPVCFWKGDLQERNKVIKNLREMKFTFEIPDEKKSETAPATEKPVEKKTEEVKK